MIAIAAVLLASGPVMHQPAAADPKVCRSFEVSRGSSTRLRQTIVRCKTQREWDAVAAATDSADVQNSLHRSQRR
jgi:hypothetical protein